MIISVCLTSTPCFVSYLRVPWTARRTNQSILKEINPGISLEGMMLKLKLQYLGSWLIGKDSDAGRDWGQEEKGTTEDEMAGWHHRLDGREFEWTLGAGDGQGGLACCDPWGRKELDMTERLNWTELNGLVVFPTFFNFSLNLAIRSSWSEPQSAPSLVSPDCIDLFHLCWSFSSF